MTSVSPDELMNQLGMDPARVVSSGVATNTSTPRIPFGLPRPKLFNAVRAARRARRYDEDAQLAEAVEAAFAAASSRCLRERVEAAEGAIDDGEVEIDAGLDELRGDEAHRLAALLALLDLGEHAGMMLRAHERGEVLCVREREGERSERLAAPGGDREAEDPWALGRGSSTGAANRVSKRFVARPPVPGRPPEVIPHQAASSTRKARHSGSGFLSPWP
jgi:hypothetical protein